MMTRILDWLARLCWRHPKRILVCVLAVTCVLGFFAAQLRVDASIMGVLNDEDPQVITLKSMIADFQAASGMVVVIDGGDEESRRNASRDVAEGLADLPSVVDTRAGLDESFIEEYGLMYLTDAQFDELTQGVQAILPGLQIAAGRPDLGLDVWLSGFEQVQAASEIQPQLVGLLAFLKTIETGELTLPDLDEVDAFPIRDGMFASANGQMYAVDVRTNLDPIDQGVGYEGFAVIDEALDVVRDRYPDLRLRFAGMIPTGFQDQQNVLQRMLPLSTLSLITVLVLLNWVSRGVRVAGMVGVVLLISLVWTFGLVHLVLGYASVMVAGFAIMLFGLGIDHAAHLLVRYNHERSLGLVGEEALTRTMVHTGRGVIVGGVTTAAAFALMSLIEFKAAVHLGVTAAMGLTCAIIAMLTVLPASLSLLDDGSDSPPPVLNALNVTGLVGVALRHRWAVVGVFTGLVVAGLSQFSKFEMETDLEAVMTQDLPALQTADDLRDAMGLTIESVLSVSPTLDEARQRAARFEASSEVSRVEGVHLYLPDDVPARLARLAALDHLLGSVPLDVPNVDAERVAEQLMAIQHWASQAASVSTRVSDAQGVELLHELDAVVQRLYASELILEPVDRLVADLRTLKSMCQHKQFGVEDLPSTLRQRYVSDRGFVSFVYPTDDRLQVESLQRFEEEVRAVDPGASGPLFMAEYLLTGGAAKMKVSLAAIILVLLVLLAWDLRSLKKVCIALIPLTCASIISMGVVLAWGRPITLVMMSAFPLIFGIGIDDSVHILHRWSEGATDMASSIGSIGKALFFTSITTGLSFSILLGLNHNGFNGLAILVILGVTTCFLSSVTLLPALASLLDTDKESQ